VFVEIRDNGDGPGIATRLAPRRHGEPVAASAHPSVASSGFGLSNMARRAAELGGTIAISDAMPGTRVVLWLPLSRSPDPDVPPGQ
jgi:signal transduction histidine kinase